MERAYCELVRRLHGQIDVVAVTSTLDETLVPLVEWRRVPVVRKPIPLKFALFFVTGAFTIRRIRRPDDIVETFGAIIPARVDVVDLHYCHAGHRTAVGRLRQPGRSRTRRVNTAVDRALALAAERWCYRPARVRAFAAVSRGVGREATAAYPGIPVVPIPNGVDAERFRPDAVARAELRDRECAGDSFVALFVGGDWERKGLAIAIGAVADARAAGHDVSLWVVGEGDVERHQRLADDRGVGDAVRFLGHRADPARLYQAADAFVFPTSYEAFSLSMLEAAASGLPLLVPPVNGAAELVGDDEGGLVLDRTEAAFARALALLVVDPARRRALGATARDRASTYTWERVAEAHLQLCRDLPAPRSN